MLHFLFTMSKSRNNGSSDGRDGSTLQDPPLTTRSIVLSLLLGSHPPEMHVAALIGFCGLFGIAAGTVRTTLSRMVDRDELTTDDGVYGLGEKLLGRQTEQDTGRTRTDVEWDGSWHVVIVAADRRPVADRRAFRSRASGAKLGELRADLWMRPANLTIPADLPGALVTRGPLLGADDGQIVHSLWDLTAIDARSRALTDALHSARTDLDAGPNGLPPSFIALARALRHLRIEPQPPERLHPPAAGDELRATYREVERAFRHTLQTFLRGG